MTTFNVGDIVRFKKSDLTFTLDDVNPNPNYKEDNEFFASGWGSYGTEYVNSEDDIELVMTAKDAANRKLPTRDEIANGLNLLGQGWGNPVDVTETEKDGSSVICYGTTSDGLEVGFRVTVEEIYETGDF